MHISHILYNDGHKSFQENFRPYVLENRSLPTLSRDVLIVLRAMLPDVEVHAISLHEGDECTCDSDFVCQILNLTMMSCRNGWRATTCVVLD